MGKKRIREEVNHSEVLQEDDELEAELRALESMRQEKLVGATDTAIQHYNKEGLLRSIEGTSMIFEESLEVCEFAMQVQDENDDLERELSFYNQTVLAVNLGKARLDALGIPTKRPVDFFCEQIKSDSHMAKIKDRLLIEQKKIELFEKRLERDSNKKFNKQVSAIKKQEQKQSSDKVVDAVKNLRKKGRRGKDSVEIGLNQILAGTEERTKSSKRIIMDKKYGFGGKDAKKRKMNDSKSINDFKDFNPKGGKFVRKDDAFKSYTSKKKGGKPNRPGKATRDKARAPRNK